MASVCPAGAGPINCRNAFLSSFRHSFATAALHEATFSCRIFAFADSIRVRDMTEDCQLLRGYIENGSEEAFSELVTRHVDLVYSVAVRLVGGDAHLAQDVVQTVFMDLSLKARSLLSSPTLPGWLCRHTFFVASAKVRTEQRRRARERQAVQMNELHQSAERDWDELSSVLDDALQQLGAPDRDAIVLRYFKRRDLKAVGAALGLSEDTAQKRVSRALEKLRRCLSKRGVALTGSTLGAVLASHAVTAAPLGMGGSVTAAIFAGSGTGSGTMLAWIKFMAWLKTNTVAASATVVLLTGVTGYLWQLESGPRRPDLGLAQRDQANSSTRAAAAFGAAPTAPFGVRWSQIESTDYRQYIANLRAIGCPEETIHDIIVAAINRVCGPRMQAIWTPPVSPYWKKWQPAKPSPDQLKQLLALDAEKAALVKDLLGAPFNGQDMTDLAALQIPDGEAELLFLPDDQRQAACGALRDSGFEAKVASLHEADPHSDQRELFSEKLAILAQVLSPEELEQFRLLASPRAKCLRNELQYFQCAAEEFKALLDRRDEHLKEQPLNLSVDRATAVEDVRALFGEQRATEYERVSDFGYLNGRSAAERTGLWSDLADQAGQIVYEARLEVERTAKDSTLPSEERQRQMQATLTEAEARVNAALGPNASAGVLHALRRTLDNTAQVTRP
jgi:RNA polymerase sigma factor (sigma-70 family)